MSFWKKSLMARLVAYFLLLSLVTVTIGVSIAYIQARGALEASLFDRLETAATLKENELDRWTADQSRVIAAVAQLPEVVGRTERLVYNDLAGAPLDVDTGVSSVAFSPDGRQLVTVGVDNSVRIWDIASGEMELNLFRKAESAQFTPDGRYLVIQSDGNIFWLWDVENEREVSQLMSDEELHIWDMSADGRLVAVGDYDGLLTVWDIVADKVVAEFAAVADDLYPFDITFSPDGRYLAVAGEDEAASVWEIASGAEVSAVFHDGWSFRVEFSPDGRYVASASQDRTAIIWEAATGEIVAQLEHDDWVNSVAFSPDGRFLISSSDDRTAVVWDAATGAAVYTLPHPIPAREAFYSPDGQLIATWDNETVRLWAAADGALRHEWEIRQYGNTQNTLTFSADGRLLAAASGMGSAFLLDAISGAEIAVFDHDTLNYAVLANYLAALVSSQSDLAELFILTDEGELVVGSDKSREGAFFDNAPYFAMAWEGTHIEPLYADGDSGQPTISVAAPIYDSFGDPVAILAAHLNLERLDLIMAERAGQGETGRAYLVAEDGRLVASAGYGEIVSSQAIDAALDGDEGAAEYENYEGTAVVGVYRWLEGQNAALIAEIERQEAFAPARQLAAVTFVTMLFLAGLLAVGVYLLARQIAEPILTVTRAATAVEAENYDMDSLTPIAQREDELGVLARVFSHMAREVYAREARLKQEVMELRIEIDQVKKEQEVAEITSSDYFQDLQAKARAMREQAAKLDQEE
jgi:WD40 repeat protein/HAMP domain-containing protein